MAVVLRHWWANTPLGHPMGEDRLPAHLWGALGRRGSRLKPAVVSALPRWVCTKAFELISVSPLRQEYPFLLASSIRV